MFTRISSIFFCSVLAYALSLTIYKKLKLLDFPERYQLKRRAIPYPTGVVAIAIFLVYFLAVSTVNIQAITLCTGIIIMGLICFVDDRIQIRSRYRLAMQIIVALLIFVGGTRIYTLTNPLGGIIKLDSFVINVPLFGSIPILSGVFSVSWLLLTMNALNWFDGISGQTSVISAIGFLLIGCLAYFRNDQGAVAEISFVLSAIAFAGFMFEFPPAKMLIGDTGSMFFGLLLGVVGIYQGGKVATTFLILGLPLIDALTVIILRIAYKKSPFQGGRDHLHHQLLDRGISPRTIILVTIIVGTIFGTIALFLSTTEKFIEALVLIVCTLALEVVVRRRQIK